MPTDDTKELPAMGDDDTKEPVEMTAADLKAELTKLRAEQARTADALKKSNESDKRRRLRLEELEADEKTRQDAKLSDEEKLKAAFAEKDKKSKATEDENVRLKDENLKLRVDILVTDEARKKNFLHPEIATKLIDRDRILIGDDGTIEGVDKAVEKVIKDYPDMLSTANGGGSPQSMRIRQGTNAGPRTGPGGRPIDPYEQELNDMGRGGRM